MRRLGVIVCLWTFGLMMLGGYVKAIHAGVACPEWPECYPGDWLPPWPADADYSDHQINAEWTHRLVAVLLGPILIAFAVLCWRERDAGRVIRYTPLAALGVLGIQVLIGGLTVINRLDALTVVAHLGTATIFFALMLITTVLLFVRSPKASANTVSAGGGRRPDGVWREPAGAQAGGHVWRDPMTGSEGRAPSPPRRDAGMRAPVAAQAQPAGGGTRRLLADYISMTKPRVMGLLILTSVTAMFLAAGGTPPLWPTLGVVVGGALATGGSGAINHFLERDLDREMERTRDRPIPAGRVSPGHALSFGVALGVLSFAVTWHFANLLAATFAMCGLLFYVFVYTLWLKRTTPLNIVIGGAAGGFPALVGWSAVTGGVGWAAWLFFVFIVVWTPPHFWALALVLKDDYGRAGVPMLPTVKGVPRTTREILAYSIVMVIASFGFFFLDVVGRVFLFSAAILGAFFLILALHLHADPSRRSARALFGYSILYLGLIYAAAFVDVALA